MQFRKTKDPDFKIYIQIKCKLKNTLKNIKKIIVDLICMYRRQFV